MLGKVMKYEVRASARTLLPLFGLGLGMSVVLRMMLWLAPLIWTPAGTVLNAVATSVGMLLLAAIVLITIASVVMRFYQSMNGSEGYLTFTLPVKPTTHIWAKLFVSTGYIAVSAVVAWVCGCIFIPGFGNSNDFISSGVDVNGTRYDLSGYEFPTRTKVLIWVVLALFVLYAIVTMLLHIYASTAIGQQFRSKLLGSVVAYFVLNTLEGLLSLPLIIVPTLLFVGRTEAQITDFMMRWVNAQLLVTNPDLFAHNVLVLVAIFLGIILASTLIFTVLHFFIAKHFYTKKINLE